MKKEKGTEIFKTSRSVYHRHASRRRRRKIRQEGRWNRKFQAQLNAIYSQFDKSIRSERELQRSKLIGRRDLEDRDDVKEEVESVF